MHNVECVEMFHSLQDLKHHLSRFLFHQWLDGYHSKQLSTSSPVNVCVCGGGGCEGGRVEVILLFISLSYCSTDHKWLHFVCYKHY